MKNINDWITENFLPSERENKLNDLKEIILSDRASEVGVNGIVMPNEVLAGGKYKADDEYFQDIYFDKQFIFSFSISKSIPEEKQKQMVKSFLEAINKSQREA